MVAAVHYFATPEDQATLLDYLGEPGKVTLHPWPLVRVPLDVLTRDEALVKGQVMVVRRDLGPLVVVRPGDSAMEEASKAGVINRMNWDRVRPSYGEGLVDSNVSPVLLWQPGRVSEAVVGVSAIGSQADAMAGVSNEYERWVNRTIGWIRRTGTKVWGPAKGSVRPDLDIQVSFLNNIYALPGAFEALERGSIGR